MASKTNLCKRSTVGRNLSASTGAADGWGMGFLLVFFPQDPQQQQQQQQQQFKNALLKRASSTNILAKAQSTISICALVIFFTLLLFTLATFEPNNTSRHDHYRRHLSQAQIKTRLNSHSHSPAFNRLGTLYSRGTKAMNEVVICHVPETTSLSELKSFMRAFHRSGLLSKSDLIFIFSSFTTLEYYDDVILDESQSFLKIIRRYKTELGDRNNGSNNILDFPASFDVAQFVKFGNDTNKEAMWGRKIKSGVMNSSSELTRLSYGSVVGFGVGEVDPENALSGFMDHVPIGLRRWASYPMILGRFRRNFKHVMLVDVKEVLLLGDPLARVKLGSPESVVLASTIVVKHGRRTSTTGKTLINPAVIVGGARGMRRLSAAMLIEIVKVTTRNKKKTLAVSESGILTRLVASEFVKKNINMVVSGELIVEASSLSGMGIANNKAVRRGNSKIDVELTKHICSFRIEGSIYTECGKYNISSV